jgi:hypothetical protein
MTKRGLLLLVVLILASTSVIGYHTAVGGAPYGTLPEYSIKEGISPTDKPKVTSFEEELGGYSIPDLVINKINLPDELPLNSIIGSGWTVEIKNIGAGKVSGQVDVDAELFSRHWSRCKVRVYSGGSVGENNPSYYNLRNMLRHTILYPGQTLIVPIYDSIGRTASSPESSCLGRILTDDLTVRITVNPEGGGGGAGQNFVAGRRVQESDTTNNIAEKTVKVNNLENLKSIKFPYRLKEGMNAFYVPVKTNISVFGFEGSTGCSLYGVDESMLKGYSNRKAPDIGQMTVSVDAFETLTPGKAYVAKCPHSATILFEGPDPGAFEKEILQQGLNLVPTRAGMMGRRAFQLLKGCANAGGVNVMFNHIVNGNRNYANKLLTEIVNYNDLIAPGDAYLVYCNTAGERPVWDISKESFAENSITGNADYIYQESRRITPVSAYIHRYKGSGSFYGQTFYYRYPKEF